MATFIPSDEAANSPLVVPGTEEYAKTAGYGLRREVLSPLETLAQSISTIAPTATPVATIPLVGALAGNGTWLAYILATAAILLVAWCVGRFARYSSSPGSLYSYASMVLPPWLGATAGWSLLLAYVATGASVIAGFYQYANVMLRETTGHVGSTVFWRRLSLAPRCGSRGAT
jgi:amino acid transporter